MAHDTYPWKHGGVHYVKRGLGDPVVLLHDVYPGADLHEFEHNVGELARRHAVYALDLLGFGQSDAPRLKYTADTYVGLIADFLTDVVAEPAAVMASGLTCAYVADVAAARPGLFTKLVLVCPRAESTCLDSPRWFAPIRRLFLTTPPLGATFFETTAGHAELTLFLRGVFHNAKHVTGDLVARLRDNARRAGTIHPCASLITGYLDKPMSEPLARVERPILLICGRDAFATFAEHGLRLLSLARRGSLEIVEDAGAWPHHEQSARVNRLVTDYLKEETPAPVGSRAAS
jgi:pimeloyl-ACP methyl ester carboxylesterase